MNLAESTYYADPKVSFKEQEERDADIRGKVEQIRVQFPRTGYRMLLQHLKRQGVVIGERRLRRILKKFELQFKHKKKFVVTTDSNHDHEVHPNLIEEMTIDGPNQVWTADLTYIRINTGFVYLAVILDLFSRKVIGWSISKKIDGALAINALEMAIKRRAPKRGVIHHSDRGVQGEFNLSLQHFLRRRLQCKFENEIATERIESRCTRRVVRRRRDVSTIRNFGSELRKA